MKKDFLKTWAKGDMTDADADVLETEMMRRLLENRLKEAFKLRLERKRRRMGYIKKGLLGLFTMGILGYFMSAKFNKKESLSVSQNTPTPSENSTTITSTFQSNNTPLKAKDSALKQTINKPVIISSNDILVQTGTQNTPPQAHKTEDNIENKATDESPKAQPKTMTVDTVKIYRMSTKDPLPPIFLDKNQDLETYDVRFLDLSKHKLASTPPSVFLHKNLENLILNDNQLTSISPDIGQLSQLNTLNINKNKLTDLPLELEKLSNLTTLYLRSNKFKIIPNSIFTLQNLTYLDFQANKISKIPVEIAQLSLLQHLNLQFNQLSKLPLEFSQLLQLSVLDLRSNLFKEYPKVLYEMPQLTQLNLSRNILKELPAEIGNLTQLKILDLHRNQLKEVPKEMGNLTELTSLDLSDNNLTYLPETFEQLTKLTYLDLRGNPISESELQYIERLLPNCKVDFFRIGLFRN